MGFDLLIFDFDGTLVDTRVDITNSVNDVLSRFHLPAKGVDEVTSYVGDGIGKIVERTINGTDIPLEEAVELFKESYAARLLQNTKTYPGVPETLDSLLGRVMAVLTNKAYRYTKAISDGLGLTGYFSVVLGGDSVKSRKPSTEGIDLILDKTGVERRRAVMIGDGPNDVLSAKNAGIQSIFVTYGFNPPEKVMHLGPDYVVDRLPEIVEICR